MITFDIDRELVSDVYHEIKTLIRQPEYYCPRDYQTIGGMWTTDIYMRDGVCLQIMDEGYSSRIIFMGETPHPSIICAEYQNEYRSIGVTVQMLTDLLNKWKEAV